MSLGATQLWELSITILKAEAGFAQLKGSLGLRPNFHQLEDRVDGRTINIRKPSQPDDEQKRVSQMLGIDWKSTFPTRKNRNSSVKRWECLWEDPLGFMGVCGRP